MIIQKTLVVLLVAVDLLSYYVVAADKYTSSAFIQSASPTVIIDSRNHKSVTNLNKYSHQQQQQNMKIFNGRLVTGVKPNLDGIALFAHKKDTTVGKGGKVQVKLLKHVAGTGHAGDVIMVAPAFFTNKLQKTGSAVRITDEEVAKENSEKLTEEKEQKENALAVKNKVESMKVSLSKKAGPDGHLFGGVNYKMILSELKKDFPQGCLDGKHIKITEVKKDDGKKLRGDIKETGDYKVNISLHRDVSANLQLSVTEE